MNGKIIYPSGEASQVTYTFIKNYDYGFEQGYLDTDDNVRAFDGTLLSYSGARKKTFDLSFSYVLEAQLTAFQLAWEVGGKFDLYLDGVNLDAVVKMMTPPIAKSEKAFDGGAVTYSFDVSFEEV